MKKLLYILFAISTTVLSLNSQSGSSSQPFTDLGMAKSVVSDGIYYFDIGGTTFSTFVKVGGFIQIARDYGNTTGNLPQVSALDTSTRGIFNTTVLAKFDSLSSIRIFSSKGGVDVTNTNTTMLAKIKNNETLHTGSAADDALNNGSWTGTGAGFLNKTGNNTHLGTQLYQNRYHASGNTQSFIWGQQYQREVWSGAGGGQIANSEYFILFAVPASNVMPLPVELLYFKASSDIDGIKLNWATASEDNNDKFIIESSFDAINFEQIGEVKGVGNSTEIQHYSFIDENHTRGQVYYRLTQHDYDDNMEVFDIISFNDNKIEPQSSTEIFPIPANEFITIRTTKDSYSDITISNTIGNLVLSVSKEEVENLNGNVIINTSSLHSGIYFVKIGDYSQKIVIKK